MIGRIKAPLRNLYHELKLINYIARSKFRSVSTRDKVSVHFDSFLMNADMGRFSFILCQYLKFCGYELIVKIDKAFIRQLAPPYKKLFLQQSHQLIRKGGGKENVVEWVSQRDERKCLEILYGYRFIGTFDTGAFYLPFPLHPKFYIKQINSDDLNAFRSQERKVLVFFAGNLDSKLYNRDVLQENFSGMISRIKALRYIRDRFTEPAELEFVTEAGRLYEILEEGAKKIVLSEARTPGDRWLSILGKAHFFLCLPGVRMPWSHNAIESMAVGTIPVIQYGSLFTPPLEHMKNAVFYTNEDELGEVLSKLLMIPEQEIAKLRLNVISYYDQYLSTEGIVGTLKAFFSSDKSTWRVIIPFLENPVK